MTKRSRSQSTARLFNIISMVFVVLSVIWVIFVILRLVGG